LPPVLAGSLCVRVARVFGREFAGSEQGRQQLGEGDERPPFMFGVERHLDRREHDELVLSIFAPTGATIDVSSFQRSSHSAGPPDQQILMGRHQSGQAAASGFADRFDERRADAGERIDDLAGARVLGDDSPGELGEHLAGMGRAAG